MTGRITLEALRALQLSGNDLSIALVLSQRLSKVVSSIRVEAVGLGQLMVANKTGSVRFWTGFVDGLIEVARCAPVASGGYVVTIENGALLSNNKVLTTEEEIARTQAALVANATAKAAASAQVALLADVPAMLECLDDEEVTLLGRLVALQAQGG